jgi:two-component system, chemotaxis family, protein-glutamate methylesterase/glutaminase
MPGHDIIVIGASAGGVETLMRLVSMLPEELPAAIFIVLHIPPNSVSAMPMILQRAGKLPAKHPEQSERIKDGQIFVAPPDRHLLVKNGHIHLTTGPRENKHRPAVDPLFRSAARMYGPRVIGVILSGALDDGTAGLQVIKAQGGIAVVQDPEDAFYAGMPTSAIENVDVDYIVPLAEMADLLVRLVHQPAPEKFDGPGKGDLKTEVEMAELDMDAIENENRPGTPSEFACPDCGGTLWEIRDDKFLRFRCRTGHAFSPESLMGAQSDSVEEALWAALRALEERASLSDRMAERARERGNEKTFKQFAEEAKSARDNASLIRSVLLRTSADMPAEPKSMGVRPSNPE